MENSAPSSSGTPVPPEAQTISVHQVVSFSEFEQVQEVRQTVDIGPGLAGSVSQSVQARKRGRPLKDAVHGGATTNVQGRRRGRTRESTTSSVVSGQTTALENLSNS
ncbi:hypothetical protein KC19_VG221500 [Ceratodon purpureus]|uniref:Uncharacterized protein n=1 Tax=Ceratodon purpureus TaxID=3225 RepID=A0A8T0HTV7_CERPU|nr:hypothetical protein KC19_VG221500 [Ceratodon purpureus]